jgi:hypothetical protein
MGGVHVGNDVDVQFSGALLVDQFEKGEPFLMTITRRRAGDQVAFEVIERGEQSQRAVPHLIMGFGANVPDAQRQARLRALERLALRFRVAAQHQRLVGRVNGDRRQARRYHCLSEDLASFLDAPHAAIAGEHQSKIVNLADRLASWLARPAGLLGTGSCSRVRGWSAASDASSTASLAQQLCRIWSCRPITIASRRCQSAAAHEIDRGRRMPARRDFAQLLLTPSVGARTVRALAIVTEIVHGAPYRFADPAVLS